ncbi:MAG: FimV/HubP family polar landmark protein, partial [Burkholderiales bacterium]
AEPAKAEPLKDAGKAPVVEAAKGDQKGAPPVAEPAKGEATKAADAAKAEPAPKPKPKPSAPPPPPPEPSLVDQLTDPVVLAGGIGGLVVLVGGALWFARRRRRAQDDDPRTGPKTAPTLPKAAPVTASMAASPMASVAAGNDDVDPLAEADLYLNFGRDAQAEEVLKEALEKNPRHEEAQLKLLQIYAARKDKAEFEKIARELHTQTAGIGDNWVKAAGMGYAFDSENPLYEAGKSAPAAVALTGAGGSAGAATDLDFDLELSAGSDPTATDMPLDSGEKTMIMRPGELAGMAAAMGDTAATQDITQDSVAAQAFAPGTTASPDFTLNAPAAGAPANVPDFTVDAPPDEATRTNVTGDSAAGPMVSAIDFNFEAPKAPEPPHDSTVIISPENQDKAADLAMDFDIGSAAPNAAAPPGTSSVVPLDPAFMLDLGDAAKAAPVIPDIKLDDISLDLDDVPKTATTTAVAGGAKDDHWYDVQTKFDLAKAYQEMGDKDGAREILQEVVKEGDAAQQTEAKQLLDTLG